MQGHIIRGSLTAIALVMATTVANAGALSDEVRLLLQSHPQIEASRATAASFEQQVKQAFSGFLPQVNLTGDAGYERVDNPARRAIQGDAYGRGRETVGILGTQLLYDGGLTQSNYTTAKLQSQSAVAQLEGTQQTVLFEGLSAYLNVLRQNELLDLSIQNEDNIRKQLNLEDERVRRGSGIAVDVLQAKSRLQLAKERRVSVEGALKDSLAIYEQVFGHPPDMARMTSPDAPLTLVPDAPEEVVAVAVAENPAIHSTKLGTAVAAQQRETAEAGYHPRLNLEMSGNYESDKNTVIGVRRDFSVLVRGNWNLFNGFATQAGVARAAFDYAASQDNALHTRRKVEEQAKRAWQALDTSRQRVALLQNAVNIASEVFVSRRKLREAGKENVINVLDAENEVFNARINLTSAIYDAKVASYQVLLSMGRLTLPNVASTGG